MNFEDLANNVKAIAGYAGGTIGTNTDTDGILLDSQGFESVMIATYVGAITDGVFAQKILETDDSGGTGLTEVPAYQVQNSFTKTPTDHSNTVRKVGAKLTKRYYKLRITSTGVTTGAVFKGSVGVLGGARNAPVA